jgi:hypothetical protein
MKLETVSHLYEKLESDNYIIVDRGSKKAIINKNTKERVMYEDDKVLELYTDSLKDLDIKGDILIVGLGFGILPYNFKDIDGVGKITAIEFDKEIIDMVKPIMPWLEIIHADAHTFESNRKWDCIFLDIYHKLTPTYKSEQRRLIDKYKLMCSKDNVQYLRIHRIEL